MGDFDTTVVELHRAPGPGLSVREVIGKAWRVLDVASRGAPILPGDRLLPGDTLFVEAHGAVRLAREAPFEGGRRGLTHSLVPDDAFKSSPSIDDVPQLIRHLEELEQQVLAHSATDPLAEHLSPCTQFDRALARDFAVFNLDPSAARALPEDLARREEAVCLFFTGDAACVALCKLSLRRMRTLVGALGRPVNPHLVDHATLRLCLDLVYDPRSSRPPVT